MVIAEYLEIYFLKNQNNQPEIHINEVFEQYKDLLLKEQNIKIINSYYNTSLNSVVHELENGDLIYTKSSQLYDHESNMKSISQFYSIADPCNPMIRNLKINKIMKKINL
jgi:hypothetical protein